MKHNRRSIRLKDYDYSQTGMYFVTICAKDRKCLFGKIKNEEMELNELGEIIEEEWIKSSEIRKEICLDEFIIMPNHLHGVVFIDNGDDVLMEDDAAVGANGRSPLRMKPKSISSFMAGFKSAVTKRINLFRNTPASPIWQRNYYERVIRNEKELDGIRQYIYYNAGNWYNDIENPEANKIITEQQRENYYKNLFK
jgi:REP element-mobilizing transposase RayT